MNETEPVALTDEPTATPAVGGVPISPRRRRAVTVVVAGTIAVALAVAAFGFYERSAADTADRAATHAMAAGRLLSRRTHRVDAQRTALLAAERALPDALIRLGQALDALATSHDHDVEVANHGVDLYNAGADDQAAAVFRGDSAAAVSDLQQKLSAVHDAVSAVQSALSTLQKESS
jgi:hypothetical protein